MSWREGVLAKLQRPWVLMAIAGVLAVIAFVPAVTGGWIYDDVPLIAGNDYFHSFEHWPRWFVEDFWNLNEEFTRFDPRLIYWRPAVSASYALDWQLSGGAPAWFHVSNLVSHAVAGVLAFVVIRRWLGGSDLAGFFAALLFAVHPTKAESVAWISGRTDILCMVAILLASEGIARRLAGKRGGVALEVFATAAAYMSKEQAIVLPAFAAIEYWVARGRPALDVRVVLHMLRGAVPHIVIAVAYLALRRAYLPIEAAGVESSLPLVDHALVVFESLGRFFTLTFAPHDLSVQQGLIRVEDGELIRSMPHVVVGIVGFVGLVAAAIVARRRFPLVTIGIAFYLATLSPTANIVFSQMRTLISERFLYLPMLGIALIAGWAFDRYRARWSTVLAAVIVLGACVMSMDRSADFRDEETFWKREVELHPNSRQARGMIIAHEIRDKRYAAAMLEILKLTETTVGDRIEIAFHLAQIVAGLVPDHDRVSLAAIETFCKELVESKPPEATLAVRELRYTIKTGSPRYIAEMPRFKLRLLALRADLASRLGNDAHAVELAREALADCPRCAGVGSIAALALARAGNYDDSLVVLDQLQGNERAIEGIRKLVLAARTERDRAFASQGPAKLQAHASELSALELWGRAYDVLAPHKDQIKTAPKAVMGFAELAVRAGEPATAREVLAGHLTPAEIEEHIATWSKKMGWQ